MQPLIEHRMDVAGFETRVLELEGDDPGVLLFHGYADSADTWRPLLAELARHDRRAIAVDLPGFGSASPLAAGAVLPQYDAFAAALASEWGEGRPLIAAGNSLGGVVSLRLAERADGLPLVGVAPIAPAGLDMPRWFEIIERDPVVRTLLAMPVPIPREVLQLSVAQAYRQLAFARPRAADRRVVAGFCSHFHSRARVGELLATGRRLLPELRAPFDLARIAAPVLLVWGTRDRMVSHSGARRVAEALPHARIELLEGVGHCPQLEATARVAELLLGFAREPAGAT